MAFDRAVVTGGAGFLGSHVCAELVRRGTRVVCVDDFRTESYWGNVNPIGPRSVYDEAKRFGEALTAAFHREHAANTGIVRIFNTYGPRMRPG